MSNCVLSEVPLLVVTREKITMTRPQHYICYTGAGVLTTPTVRGGERKGRLNLSSQLSYPAPHEKLQSFC